MLTKYAAAGLLAVLMIAVVTLGCGQTMSRTYVYKNSSRQGWLGVELQDVDSHLKAKKHLDVDEGAYVSGVVDESPAQKAGIEEGDVITKFDGKTIDDSEDLMNAVRRVKPKTEVKIDVVRGKDRKTLTATIGKNSEPRSYSFNFNDGEVTPRIPNGPFQLHLFSSQRF